MNTFQKMEADDGGKVSDNLKVELVAEINLVRSITEFVTLYISHFFDAASKSIPPSRANQ